MGWRQKSERRVKNETKEGDNRRLSPLFHRPPNKKGRAKRLGPMIIGYKCGCHLGKAFSSSASFSGETVSACRSPKMTRYSLSETFHRIRTLSASFGGKRLRPAATRPCTGARPHRQSPRATGPLSCRHRFHTGTDRQRPALRNCSEWESW